jgi:hypothetical protein
MHLTAPSHWSRSIVTGGRDASEQVDAIIGMRKLVPGGHIGLFMGFRNLKLFWPLIARWIAVQSYR